ncbi:GNAT family N-acetyltransferase [Streptomyces violarus]|nr:MULTISPECIES: GNAT family N-acetyltransferase [Streptomyces]WRU03335.1 GNAT family N-acetyltransferase [Streptomyces sp. CGMCC 4.1772]
MTEYAHTKVALPRVILEIEPDNHPSIAVARSAGFHPSQSWTGRCSKMWSGTEGS